MEADLFMAVYRIYTEKKPQYAVEAQSVLADLRTALRLDVQGIRVLNRYDADRLSEAALYKNMKDFTLPIFLKQLRDNHVKCLYEADVLEITGKGVRIRTADGSETLLEADTVITAFGLKADREQIEALKDVVADTYVIGDAHRIGVIGDATNDAYRICLDIE